MAIRGKLKDFPLDANAAPEDMSGFNGLGNPALLLLAAEIVTSSNAANVSPVDVQLCWVERISTRLPYYFVGCW
jgi:hypothetical protein